MTNTHEFTALEYLVATGMQYGMQYGRDLDLDLARRQSSMRHTADPLFLSRSVEYRNSILYGTEYTYPYGTVLPYGSRAVLSSHMRLDDPLLRSVASVPTWGLGCCVPM